MATPSDEVARPLDGVVILWNLKKDTPDLFYTHKIFKNSDKFIEIVDNY